MDPDFHAAVDELRRHVDASAVETRRHFDVVGEARVSELGLRYGELESRLHQLEVCR